MTNDVLRERNLLFFFRFFFFAFSTDAKGSLFEIVVQPVAWTLMPDRVSFTLSFFASVSRLFDQPTPFQFISKAAAFLSRSRFLKLPALDKSLPRGCFRAHRWRFGIHVHRGEFGLRLRQDSESFHCLGRRSMSNRLPRNVGICRYFSSSER